MPAKRTLAERATPTDAARRLLAGPRSYRDGTHSEQADVQTVAEAVLSVNDDTPLTADYLVSVGARCEDHPQKWTFERGDALPIGLWHVDDGWKAMLLTGPHSATCIVRGLQTRGALRLLAMALGVTIRE